MEPARSNVVPFRRDDPPSGSLTRYLEMVKRIMKALGCGPQAAAEVYAYYRAYLKEA